MKILVTGASGFIGGNLVQHLAQNNNFSIQAIGRKSMDKFSAFTNVVYTPLALSKTMQKIECDICIHCAGLADDKASHAEFIESNVTVTENLIANLQGCHTLIFISSSSVYNFKNQKVKIESDVALNKSISVYGQSKLLAEKLISESGINSIYILRPRAVYGLGDQVLLPRILTALKGNRMIVPGSLNTACSLTHIDNLLQAIDKAILLAKPGIHIYNIADKISYNLKSVFTLVAAKKVGSVKFVHLPLPFVKLAIKLASFINLNLPITQQSLDYLSLNSVLDIGVAENEIGYDGKRNLMESIDTIGL